MTEAERPVMSELQRLDHAVYLAIGRLHVPALDVPLRRLSDCADHAKPWLAIAGLLALFGGRPGRRAARTGLAAIGLSSALVNLPLKLLGRRPRPPRHVLAASVDRHAHMPRSNSFPSGHSASAFAFAYAVGGLFRSLATPLRALALVVAYSRVHTGVHYPGDVLAGSLIGMAVGKTVARIVGRHAASQARAAQRR